jgi:integral membrane protein (TIGR01906 family)
VSDGSAAAELRARSPRRLGTLVGRVSLGLASGLCALALPLALVSSNVRAVALDQRFYTAEFARYDIGPATGFTSEQLRSIAQAFIVYFDDPPGRMDVQVARGVVMQPLFNERELAHMEDVQALMHLVARVRLVALAYIGAYVLAGLLWRRAAFVPVLARTVAAGAGVTGALFVGLGALAATDFSELFIQFHLVSFANDLWQLDPRRDYLIRLFPQGFFQDAALRVAALTIAQALLLGVAALLALWVGRRQARLRTARSV